MRTMSNSRNTGCEIINQGRSSAASGWDVIVNPKLERNLIALLLQKKSNIKLESETALLHEVVFLLSLAGVLCLILGIQFKCRLLG